MQLFIPKCAISSLIQIHSLKHVLCAKQYAMCMTAMKKNRDSGFTEFPVQKEKQQPLTQL